MKLKLSRYEAELIGRIADRAEAMAQNFDVRTPDRTTLVLDLINAHQHVPLKLHELLAARDGDFAHDIWGIQRHIDRQTGRLEGCFLPRYALVNDSIGGAQ